MVVYPKVKVCAAHVAPVYLDAQATVAKAASLIAEAAEAGAQLIAFPESFVPGFPVWAAAQAPIKSHDYFKKLAANSIAVPGPEVGQFVAPRASMASSSQSESARARRSRSAACGIPTC
jgi:nitrilase